MTPAHLKRGRRYALILAAGQGTRIKSRKAKVLHPLCGRPLLAHVLDKLTNLNIDRTFVVIGHEAAAIKRALEGYPVEFIVQKRQLGTGHALLTATPHLRNLSGSLLVLCGDTPLISRRTLRRLLKACEEKNADQVLLTSSREDPTGYGRMIRDDRGKIVAIVEEKEATKEQRAIGEINPGFYCFRIPSLLSGLTHLSRSNRSREYYLTDVLHILRTQGKKIVVLKAGSPQEIIGINTRQELAEVELILRSEIIRKWMSRGVTILDPSSVYIDDSVTIASDVVIYPGVVIEGQTRIGRDCVIRSFSHLRNAVLQEGAVIDHCSVVRESSIGRSTTVGPFAHLRQDTLVGSGARIGNFVEIKKSSLAEGTKAAHLTYLGDAQIGQKVNIGAGTITCNYDGFSKNQTVIEDNVFIGGDTQLVAPVTIGKNAYVAAGSSITRDVPSHSLAIARSRQINKIGWSKTKEKELRKRGKKKTKKAKH